MPDVRKFVLNDDPDTIYTVKDARIREVSTADSGKVLSVNDDGLINFNKNVFVFEQQEPSVVWTIHHDLNKYPSITILDEDGVVVCAEVKYISNNKVQLFFNTNFSGIAYLN